MITRVINGTNDFGDNGYIGSDLPTSLDNANPFLSHALHEAVDTGPDLFYFNFMGHIGKFMFSQDGELITDPNNKLWIEPLDNELDEWVVRDAMGYQYVFGGYNAVEQVGFTTADKWAVTSWYLKRVLSPLGEVMEFHYHNALKILTEIDLRKEVVLDGGTNLVEDPPVPSHHFVPYLSSITIDKGSYVLRVNFDSEVLPSNKRVLTDIKFVKIEGGNIDEINRFYLYTDYDGLTNVVGFAGSMDRPISSIEVLYSDKNIDSIKYSSEKSIKYTFEPNTYDNATAPFGAGVRNSSIITDDGNGNSVTTTIGSDVHSALYFPQPVTQFDTERWHESNGQTYDKRSGQVSANFILPAFSTVLGGPLVGYGYVQVATENRGKTLYTFENHPYLPETTSKEGYYAESLFPPMFGMDFRNGKLKSQTSRELVDGQWKSIQHIRYHNEPQAREALTGVNVVAIDAGGDGNISSAVLAISNGTDESIDYRDVSGMQVYTIPTSWSRLASVETTYIGENGQQQTTVDTYDYVENSAYLSAATTTFADGNKERAMYSYPFDYDSQEVYDEMVDRHMLASPIEVRTEQQSAAADPWEIKAGVITSYGFFGGQSSEENRHILPDKSYLWEKAAEGESVSSEIPSISSLNYKLNTALQYNDYGNPIESKIKRHTTSTLWSTDQMRPIASINNASVSEVYYTGFEEAGTADHAKTGEKSLEGGSYTIPFTPPNDKDYLLSYWYYQNDKWEYREKPFVGNINEGTALDEVRVYPVGSQMMTYGYDALGNMISRTDANNILSYFDYNEMNQLTTIRNKDRDIVRTKEHNYSYIPPCEKEGSLPIQASFANGDRTIMDVDKIYTFEVEASGGCGDLYYNWYLTGEEGNEDFLGITATSEIQLKAPCSEAFTIRCEVMDEQKTDVATAYKYGTVNLSSADLNVTLVTKTGSTFFSYCDGDQIYVMPIITGSCNEYTYHWEYAYYWEDEWTREYRNGSYATFAFGKRGTVTCTITDGYGYTVTETEQILEDHKCR